MPSPPSVSFLIERVAFLSQIVSGDGIRVDTQMIKKDKSWPKPTCPTNMKSFLGLASSYRMFVEGFSSISSQLSMLIQIMRLTGPPR